MSKNKFNPSETTPKERILKKVRKALLLKRDNPYSRLEEAPMYPPMTAPLDITFATQLNQAGGNFVYCEDELELVEHLIAITETHRIRKIYVWEPTLQLLLDRYDFPYYKTDTGFLKAEVGITTCEALIARSGSILVSNAGNDGRRLSIYPAVHIVIARSRQVVADLKDGFQLLTQKYGHQLPSMISIITGTIQSQGPKEVYVLLLD